MRSPLEREELREVMTAYGRQQAVFGDAIGRFFSEIDLTMAQFRALTALHRWGRMTGRELARRLRVTPGTLVPMMDRLEALDYVRRVPDLDDRRLTWLELTPKGERLFHRLWGVGTARVVAAVGRLSPSDRATLARLLNLLADDMEMGFRDRWRLRHQMRRQPGAEATG
jgi:DNA-binding MarR family transcriptional regulator